jgi:Rab3 GTPase-activating protein catalytic subunit
MIGIPPALQRIGAGGLYPAPPEEIFSNNNVQYQHPSTSTTNHAISQSKGSPPGRLLSILFAHMARLRTPPSMMSLWLAFVEELRFRWDRNESLPNLGLVPGLDEEILDAQHGHAFHLNGRDCRVLGHRAHLAAFVNSSEPDPDRSQCIINQKLQVFNICIETKMSLEALEAAHNEDLDSMEVDGSASNSDSDEFFDPEEEEVSFESSSREANSKEIEAMLKMEAAAVANSGHNRIGARCPVPDGLPLVETGGQVRLFNYLGRACLILHG